MCEQDRRERGPAVHTNHTLLYVKVHTVGYVQTEARPLVLDGSVFRIRHALKPLRGGGAI